MTLIMGLLEILSINILHPEDIYMIFFVFCRYLVNFMYKQYF